MLSLRYIRKKERREDTCLAVSPVFSRWQSHYRDQDVRCVLACRTERAPVFPRWFSACHCLQMMATGISNSGTWHSCATMDGAQQTMLMVWLHLSAKGKGPVELIECGRKSGSWAKVWSESMLTAITVLCIMPRHRNLGQLSLCEGNEYLEECQQRSGTRKKLQAQ